MHTQVHLILFVQLILLTPWLLINTHKHTLLMSIECDYCPMQPRIITFVISQLKWDVLPNCSPMDCYTRTLCHWCWKTTEAKLLTRRALPKLEQRRERSRNVCTHVTSHNSWRWHDHKVWQELCNHTPICETIQLKKFALSVTGIIWIHQQKRNKRQCH